MSEDIICCPLTGCGYDEQAEFYSSAIVRAKKVHKCTECHEAISSGSKYERATGKWEGDISTYKTCLSCVEIRNHFVCEGWAFGLLWSDLEENFFPEMRAGGPCLEGLSPEAKARLFERRMKWYEEVNG